MPSVYVLSLLEPCPLTLWKGFVTAFYLATHSRECSKHNRPIPKFFGNQPSASASAVKVFGETIALVIYLNKIEGTPILKLAMVKRKKNC